MIVLSHIYYLNTGSYICRMDTGTSKHLEPADLMGNNLVERHSLSEIDSLMGSMIVLTDTCYLNPGTHICRMDTGTSKHLEPADPIGHNLVERHSLSEIDSLMGSMIVLTDICYLILGTHICRMDTGTSKHLEPADPIGHNLVERHSFSEIDSLMGSMIVLTDICYLILGTHICRMDTGTSKHLEPADPIGNNLVELRMIAQTGIPKYLDLADRIVP